MLVFYLVQRLIIKGYEYLHFYLYLLVCCGIGLKLVGLGMLFAECHKSGDEQVIDVDCMSDHSEMTEFSILLFLHPFIFDYFMPVYRSVPEISDKRQAVIQGLHIVTWVFVFIFFGLGISLSENHFAVVLSAPLLALLIMYIENNNSKAIHNDSKDILSIENITSAANLNDSAEIKQHVSISLQRCVTKKVESIASSLFHDVKTPLQSILLQVHHCYSYSLFIHSDPV